jgi:hypothetical protein
MVNHLFLRVFSRFSFVFFRVGSPANKRWKNFKPESLTSSCSKVVHYSSTCLAPLQIDAYSNLKLTPAYQPQGLDDRVHAQSPLSRSESLSDSSAIKNLRRSRMAATDAPPGQQQGPGQSNQPRTTKKIAT